MATVADNHTAVVKLLHAVGSKAAVDARVIIAIPTEVPTVSVTAVLVTLRKLVGGVMAASVINDATQEKATSLEDVTVTDGLSGVVPDPFEEVMASRAGFRPSSISTMAQATVPLVERPFPEHMALRNGVAGSFVAQTLIYSVPAEDKVGRIKLVYNKPDDDVTACPTEVLTEVPVATVTKT
jgi:hypothetical protein